MYLESSLKKGVRASRGPAPTMIIKDNIKIIMVKIRQIELSQQFVETCRDQVHANTVSIIIHEDLQPCDHKELTLE